MGNECNVSPQTKLDVHDIYYEGLVEYGEYQANKYLLGLMEAFELLAVFPLKNRSAANLYPNLRRKEINPYTILYLPRDHGVYVVRVLRQEMKTGHRHLSDAIRDEAKGGKVVNIFSDDD